MARSYLRISGPSQRGRWPALVLIVLAVAVAGVLGAIASAAAASFYDQLQRPGWAPPARLFAPVWTALYVLMAAAAWLAWRARALPAERHRAFAFFAGQLVLNALWSWLFFRWHLGALALVDSILLWLAILLTVWQFWRLRPVAAVLLLPYLLWVGFATALNAAVWQLNPTLL